MRKLLSLIAAAGLLIGMPSFAQAADLTLESGTLSVGIGALPPISIPATSSPTIAVSTGGGSFVEPAGIFDATVVLAKNLFTGVPLISSLNVTAANGTGTFVAAGGPGGGFGGPGPIQGQAVIGVLGGLVNLNVPLTVVGQGGVAQAGAAQLSVTVTGAEWTTGVASVTGITTETPNGGFTNTAILTGVDNRAADHTGSIVLVTPIRILTNAAGNLPGFATQDLSFVGNGVPVPEPGTLLLLGSGVVGLALLGRRRMRK